MIPVTGISIVAISAALNALIILALAYNVGRHRDRAGALEPQFAA